MACRGFKHSFPHHALRGLHGAADPDSWPYDDEAFRIIQVSKTQAVKLLTGGNTGAREVNRLHSMGVFVMARVFGTVHTPKTGKQFAEEAEESVARLYAAGVEYFEIHNEPNLFVTNEPNGPKEGLGVAYEAENYADWWLGAKDHLASLFPAARWGFPAMSPGRAVGGIRYDPEHFLRLGNKAIIAADFINCHSYWGYGRTEYDSIAEIRNFAGLYNKLIFVSEFSNSEPVDKAKKGEQYANFYRLAKTLPKRVGGLFSYCMSASSGFENETWRGSPIPEIVGAAF